MMLGKVTFQKVLSEYFEAESAVRFLDFENRLFVKSEKRGDDGACADAADEVEGLVDSLSGVVLDRFQNFKSDQTQVRLGCFSMNVFTLKNFDNSEKFS